MSVKAVMFSLGCLLAWCVLMPVLVVGGGVALFAYAVLAEMGIVISGHSEKSVDPSTARALAHRMCLGSRSIR